MNDPMNPAPAPTKQRRGCFFYGCIVTVILFVIVVGAGIAGYYTLKKTVNNVVQNYTDTQPMTLPTVTMSQEEIDKVKKRLDTFEEDLKSGKATEPLVLTSDDINALIMSGNGAKDFKGKLYVTLDGDKAKGEVSIPLTELSKSRLFAAVKDRYLNGSCTFNVSLRDGILFIAPDTILVKGNPLPESFMQALRNQNFAEGTTNDASTMAVVRKLEAIEIKDSKLIMVPKTSTGAAEANPGNAK